WGGSRGGGGEGGEEGLPLRGQGQRVLRSTLRAGERRRGVGEGDRLLERAARGQSHGERAVEGITRRRGIDRLYGKGGEVHDALALAGEHAPFAHGHQDHAGPRGAQVRGGRGRILERIDGEVGQPCRPVLVRRQVVREREELRVERLHRRGIQDRGHALAPRFGERPPHHGQRRLELAGDHVG